MITNEELLMSYPDQWTLISGTLCQVDVFNTIFDSVNAWLLTTSFDPTTAGYKSGMIVQVSETTGSNPKSGLYVISSLVSTGMILKRAGFAGSTGRGPGQLFGSAVVKATIFDFSPVIQDGYALAGSVVAEKLMLLDETLGKCVDMRVKQLVLLRLSVYSDDLKTAIGLDASSIVDLQEKILEQLKSDYLRSLAGKLGTSVNWTRIVR